MKETGISKNNKTDGSGVTGKLYIVLRIAVLVAVLFIPKRMGYEINITA